MSKITTNPAIAPRAFHRARIVTEAVVSGYIRDISRPQLPRELPAIRLPCLAPPRGRSRTSLAARGRRRAPHGARTALELSAENGHRLAAARGPA
jgi:hypothetical protein